MTDDPASDQTPSADDPRAVRLTFSYRGDAIELLAVQRVNMFVPPSDPLEDRTPRSGFWLELRDAAGGLVFRLGMHDPIAGNYEVFPADPRGEIVRQPVQARAGAFSVVIPELSAARRLAFVATPAAVESLTRGATELVSFDMDAVMRRAGESGR
jgi:hypothetical protein